MIPTPLNLLMLLLIAFAPGVGIAQPSTPPVATPPAAAIDAGLWMDGVRAAYVAEPVHERHEVTISSRGETMSSHVILRSEHRGAITRMFLQLGPLDILAEANRIGIVHRHNPRTILLASATPDHASLLDTLLCVVPPIPLPQLAWAADHRCAYGDQLAELSGLSPWLEEIRLVNVAIDARGAAIGASSDSDAIPHVQMLVGPRNRVTSFRFRRRAEGSELAELTVDSREIPPVPLPTWEQFAGQREPVSAISQLRSAPSQIVTGASLPSLGLMSRHMASWDLAQFMRSTAQASPADVQLTALLLHQAAQPEAVADAFSGLAAARLAARELRQRSALKEISSTRLTILPVGVLSIDDVRPERLDQLSREWNSGMPPRTGQSSASEGERVWTTIGPEAIERFVPLSAAVIVIVDDAAKVVGVLPLDQRRGDIQALEAELLEALAGR